MTAIAGVTVIDGTGALPRRDATVLLQGRQILAVGPRRAVPVPAGAQVIDGRGLFVLPGFIDANVHLSRYFGPPAERADSVHADSARNDSLIVARLARAVRYGVTTVRDSRGALPPLRAMRDRLRSGRLTGARLLIAGPVVGSGRADGTGVGQDLINREADSLRTPIRQYVEQGVDFIKYSGTVSAYDFPVPDPAADSTPIHDVSIPFLVFSDSAQRVIVDEAHRRGVRVETHATSPDGLRAALLAGVDLVEHPEVMSDHVVLSDELVRLFAKRRVLCALLPRVSAAAPGSSYWRNAQRLIRGGCTVTVGSGGSRPGMETLEAIEGLVALGMTPMEALVAATRNGARAANRAEQLGTVETGKLADLVVLRADPRQDIANIEQIEMVFKEGVRVEPETVRQQKHTGAPHD